VLNRFSGLTTPPFSIYGINSVNDYKKLKRLNFVDVFSDAQNLARQIRTIEKNVSVLI
jgi:hypothetical protein